MDIRELKYFLAVAREESISKAANYLYITQPSLTRQMQSLEKEIGKPLFSRKNRKMTLTETGSLLRKHAEEIVALYEKTQKALSSPSERVSGEVYIGCSESYAVKIIAKIAKEIRSEYPNITFHLSSGDSIDVSEKLEKGLLDFGILIEAANLNEYDGLRLPVRDVWGVLMRKDAPLARKEVIEPQDLTDKPIICSKHSIAIRNIARWMKTDPEKLNIVATYNLIYNASLLVEEGIGYAIGLDKLIHTGTDSPFTFRPLSPLTESPLDIVWKKYQIFSPAAQIFLQKLQERIPH
ncbi:MAG: LysR family transcriptional regulator [Clostridia bacterium]|nr:LysR family transcriptional regulator [Clostridia bacterium]